MGGKAQALPDGHPRRIADGKNAFRKMSDYQRAKFITWINLEIPGWSLMVECPAHGWQCVDGFCETQRNRGLGT